MPQEILNILYGALGLVITGLVTWGVTKFTQWINTKIEDRQAANYLSTIMTIVGNCVKEIYQTYVEGLKEEGGFDEKAHKKAQEMCLAKIKGQLAPDLIEYITQNFGDMTEYLKTLIESVIYTFKNNK